MVAFAFGPYYGEFGPFGSPLLKLRGMEAKAWFLNEMSTRLGFEDEESAKHICSMELEEASDNIQGLFGLTGADLDSFMMTFASKRGKGKK